MPDLLSLFKEIYKHRDLAFSKRFLLFTLVLIVGFVTGLFNTEWWFSGEVFPLILILSWFAVIAGLLFWGLRLLPFEATRLKYIEQHIEKAEFKEAQNSLERNYLLTTPVFNIRRELLKVSLLKQRGLMHEAYKTLKFISSKPLITTERNIVELAKASLFFETGNYRDALIIFKSINRSYLINVNKKVRYALLASELAEINGDFRSAKAELEQVLDDVQIEGVNEAFVYHNLARLEGIQGNKNTALGYYEKSWNLLRTSRHFFQISVTAENLILLQARIGDSDKARKILNEYKNLIDINNPIQLLEFNNCTIALAREINDRSLLLKAYQSLTNNIPSKITQEEQINLLVSELRMRFNDRVDFETHLAKTMGCLSGAANLLLLHKLTVYKEVLAILRQVMEITVPRPDLLLYHGWICFQFIQLEGLLDSQRSKIPSSLPSYREQWLIFKLELLKSKLHLYPLGVPKKEFKSMFETLTELKNIWSDKDNQLREMKALVIILDEYAAYSEELNSKKFKEDYAELAHTTLEQAETLLEANLQHPAMYEFTAGLAYFWSRIANHKSKVEYWLGKFESKEPNLNHFANWYRERYKKTNEWLAQQKSNK